MDVADVALALENPTIAKVECKYAAPPGTGSLSTPSDSGGQSLAGTGTAQPDAVTLEAVSPAKCRPVWATHPSLTTALDCLHDYNTWISEIVMPIAFQWIEDNYDAVYAQLESEGIYEGDPRRNDVGVVIAAAFQIVRTKGCYQDELKAYDKLQSRVSQFDTETLTHSVNPVWSSIAEVIRGDVRVAFEQYRNILDDTIGRGCS